MIEGEEIVCFAHDWGGDPTSKTHIMRLLAKKNRVLWVNSIAMRRPVASKSDARRLIAKFRRAFAGCAEREAEVLGAGRASIMRFSSAGTGLPLAGESFRACWFLAS